MVKYVVLASIGVDIEKRYGVMRGYATHDGKSGQSRYVRISDPSGDSKVRQLRCVISANPLAIQHVRLQLQLVAPDWQDRSATARITVGLIIFVKTVRE